ncbi:MAG: hypothetical protein WCE48_04665 [Steroidobacteraceae bacterium]
MATITIDRRFRGPDASAHGGYFAGRVAALADRLVSVRLHRPPPLDTPLRVRREPDGGLCVLHEDTAVAEARPAALELRPPRPPTYIEALEVACQHRAYASSPYRECFVCGAARQRGDGLRIHPGTVGDGRVAAAWIPDPSLAGPDGKVKAEFLWAALDCPGYYASSPDGRPMLLGEFTAHADRLVHADEPCVLIGWRISSSGRKHAAGTAIFDEDGELCGVARGLWIEPRASAE